MLEMSRPLVPIGSLITWTTALAIVQDLLIGPGRCPRGVLPCSQMSAMCRNAARSRADLDEPRSASREHARDAAEADVPTSRGSSPAPCGVPADALLEHRDPRFLRGDVDQYLVLIGPPF